MRDSTKIRILYVTVIILLIIIVILLLHRCNGDHMVVDPNVTDILSPTDNPGTSDDGISVVGFKRLRIKANTTDVSGYFINPASNEVYFVARLCLEDGTLLYQSGLIPPGKAIYAMEIQRPLPPGLYNAVLYYDTYSLNDRKQGTILKLEIVLEVE